MNTDLSRNKGTNVVSDIKYLLIKKVCLFVLLFNIDFSVRGRMGKTMF